MSQEGGKFKNFKKAMELKFRPGDNQYCISLKMMINQGMSLEEATKNQKKNIEKDIKEDQKAKELDKLDLAVDAVKAEMRRN